MPDRYVVAAGGNFSAAATWSATDGGAGGAGAPSSTDNAYLSNLSGNLVVDTTSACLDLDCTKGTGFAGAISGAGSLSVHGAMTLRTGMTWSVTGALVFRATSGTKAITSNGVALTGTPVTFNGSGATFQLADTLTITSPSNGVALAMSAGTFDPNGKTVVLNGVGVQISGAFTFFNLTRTGPVGSKVGTLSLTADIAITGTLTVTGNSATDRVFMSSSVVGTPRTVTAAGVALTNVDFMDIAGAGAAAPFTGASLGDALGNSGITMTPSVTQTATGTASFTWSTHGWTTRVPLPQDDVVIPNAFTAGRTVTVDMPRMGRSVDFTGCTGGVTVSATTVSTLFGSLTLSSGVLTGAFGASNVIFGARSAATITCAGRTLKTGGSIIITGPGGVFTLLDAFACTGSASGAGFSMTAGTLTTNGFSVTVAGTFTLGSGCTLNAGASTIETTLAGAMTFIAGSTLNAGTSTFKISDATASAKSLSIGAGTVFHNFWFSGSGRLGVGGSGTFNDFRVDTPGVTVNFTASTTQTVNSFTVNGTTASGSDVNFAQVFGTAGGYFSTPDAVANSISGDIDIRIKARASWQAFAIEVFCGKRAASNQESWQIEGINGTNTIRFGNTTVSGSIVNPTASSAMPFASGALGDIKITRVAATGAIAYYYSTDDGASWTPAGTATSAAGALFDATALLEVGSVFAGGTARLTGSVYRMQIRNGIDGPVVVDFNPNDYAGAGASTWNSATTGETWTKNGNAIVSATNQVAICSATAASHTLTKAGGGQVVCENVSVNRSTAGPGTSFVAVSSVDGGNNSGWVFGTLSETVASAAGAATVDGRTSSPIAAGFLFVVRARPHHFKVPAP